LKLSYVIVTRNRRDTLLRTLARLQANTGLPGHAWEVFVIDNGSEDDTAAAVATKHRDVNLIRLDENEGIPARNRALPLARGRYLVFLDDDSYPMPGAIPPSLAYLNRTPGTAALVARVVLPDGRLEAPAFPNVSMGGASVLRASAIKEVGGFAPEFFRQAEEYDLSFRMWRAGHRVERFEDVVFGHDKVADPNGRNAALTHRMDLRNNLILVERYLPRGLRGEYRKDFIQRYVALAVHDGCAEAASAGLHEGHVWARREKAVGRKTLDPESVEHLFDLRRQSEVVAEWVRRQGVKRVALGDFSKNVYATFRACRGSAAKVACLLDNRAAFKGMEYRGLPVLPDPEADAGSFEAIVLSNVNPAQVDARYAELAGRFGKPVLRLWEPRTLATAAQPPKVPEQTPEKSVA
jgi:GT2 family glycosyltransferase